MPHALYSLAFRLLAPFARLWLRFDPGHRVLLERFQPDVSTARARSLWIHACSVGEVNAALPLIQALRERCPALPVVLSASTVTGLALARERAATPVIWCPVDHPAVVGRFFDRLDPGGLVLIETELWPNILRACKARRIPVVVVNGRLSDKHFPRYRRMKRFWRAVFDGLTVVGAQSEVHAARFEALGVPSERVTVTGSTKFDAVADAVPLSARNHLRRICRIPAEVPVLVFGSTRPGDEALAAATWRELREAVPGLRLVVVPRHVDRREEARVCFDEPVAFRSLLGQPGAAEPWDVLIVDTVGELVQFYALASVAVVGGSFFGGVGGHNPIEPCALGVPTIFGPCMANFLEPARILTDARGAIQVGNAAELADVLRTLLLDPAERRQLGTRARKAVLANRGALERSVSLILGALEGSPDSV